MKWGNLYVFRTISGIQLSVGLSVLWLFLFYSDIIYCPNCYWPDKGYDALRAYHVFQTLIHFEEGWFNTKMINYPFGENIFYLDCNPPLLWGIKFLSNVFPALKEYSIGIYNVILLLSLPLCALISYKIIVHYHHAGIWQGIFAFCIAVFCPQVLRWVGHPALGLYFFIPLTWFICILIIKNPRRRYPVFLLFISNLFWLLVHPYNGMMCLIFSGLFLLYFFFSRRQGIKHILEIVFSTMIPFFLYFLLIYLTDSHENRTKKPFGFFEFKAVWEGFVFPIESFSNYLKKFQSGPNAHHYDAAIYLGVGNILILFSMFFCFILRLYQPPFIQKRDFMAAIIPSIVMLLFSFGIPFIFYPEAMNHFPFIASLRYSARFAWPFWFLVSMSSSLFLLSLQKPKLRVLLLLFFAIIQVVEAIPFHNRVVRIFTANYNPYLVQYELPWKEVLCEDIDASEYAAVIPLPFFHIGSNNFYRDGDRETRVAVMLFTYYTRIPLMTSPCIRVSESEARMHFELMSPSFYEKEIEHDIREDARFIIFKKKAAPLEITESQLLSKAKFLKSAGDFELFEISSQSIFKNTAANQWLQFNTIKSELEPKKEGFFTTDTSAFFYFNDFEAQVTDKSLFGRGAMVGKKNEYHVLADFSGNNFKAGTAYMASFWLDNDADDATSMSLVVEERDKITGESKWIAHVNPSNSLIVDGKRTLAEVEFVIQNQGMDVRIFTIGYPYSNAQVCFDHFMIREKNIDYYLVDSVSGMLIKNNHVIRIPKEMFNPKKVQP
jgi:hypothetical protein